MADPPLLFSGEFRRSLDERHRLNLPSEILSQLPDVTDTSELVMVKERPGALSLWPKGPWEEQLEAGIELIRRKIAAGRLAGRTSEVQQLGRLLSTRHRVVSLAARGRIVIPEGFREFLGIEPGGESLIIGAAVCVEIWRPDAWLEYLNDEIPRFGPLFDQLSG